MSEFVNKLKNLWATKKMMCIGVIIVFLLIVVYFATRSSFKKSGFTTELNVPVDSLNSEQPKVFPNITKKTGNFPPLAKPVVPEEIGLAMVYPQGSGVGMSILDSNSFYPDKPGTLLTDFKIPPSYGESSLTDPNGTNGAQEGARVLRIASTGSQTSYKPTDESRTINYAAAYSDGEVQSGQTLIEGHTPINYTDSFVPENNLVIQTSPGQQGTKTSCEKTYPNVIKYGDFCITEGDIPYGQVVDGKVNPRLVSRWESFTGDYSRDAALTPIDGVLYPNLAILTN
jgi:hypothetical protein